MLLNFMTIRLPPAVSGVIAVIMPEDAASILSFVSLNCTRYPLFNDKLDKVSPKGIKRVVEAKLVKGKVSEGTV